MTSIKTLQRLARNPHYKMTDDEVKELHEYQEQGWGVKKPKRRKTKTYKHDPAFEVHSPDVPMDNTDLIMKRDTRGRG